jgi:putative tryptophan/tyrosine transport system substrate-binding protein
VDASIQTLPIAAVHELLFFEGDNSLIMPEIARDCRYTEYFRWRRFTGANASKRSEAHMRRREFIAGVGFAAASASWPLAARAQQAKKIPVLGVLWHAENAEGEIGRVEALRRGLEEFGRVEGKNIKIIDTFAAEQYERFDINAVRLAAVPVDVLFAHTQPAAMAAHRATDKIPIVFTWVPDPVQIGLVASLNRPGGNITGFSNVAVDLSGKKLQMMKEVTGSSRLGFLANGNDANIASRSAQALKAAAVSLAIALHVIEVRGANEIDAAFDEFARREVGGVITQPDALFFNERKHIAQLAIDRKLATLGHVEELADDGFLMTLGPSGVLMIQHAASYVDKILNGTPPGELPVELPTKIDLVINNQTASKLGLTVPPGLLVAAERVVG